MDDRNRRVYALEKHGDTERDKKMCDKLVWSERWSAVFQAFDR